VSLLAGTTPGVHWPTARGQYLRRVRYSTDDPMVTILAAAGYPVETDVANPKTTVVVTFPTQGPDMRSEREVSVWEKMYLAVHHQRYWADNMVSLTASFMPHEVDQIPAVLRAFDGQLKTISMLPLSESGGAYAQMPYEQVPESEWQDMWDQVRPIALKALYTNGADATGERFCSSDRCEIILPVPAEADVRRDTART
jgi:ribonucleoside-triphosphate reductase (thioredoxin)